MKTNPVYKTGLELRLAARAKRFTGPTAGHCTGYVQANLAVLPRDWAFDFFLFAQRNPKPCPLLEVGDVGDPHTRFLADGADIRTDLPKYCVYRDGRLVVKWDLDNHLAMKGQAPRRVLDLIEALVNEGLL